MLPEDNVLPQATERHFLIFSALHAKNDTTNLFYYKLGESAENNKALLSSQVRKQFNSNFERFHLSHHAVVCEVINLWIAMFENSAKICFETFAGFDPSIRSYVLTVSFLILLRSLRVYILRKLFFSISVNSGFRIFTSPLRDLLKIQPLFTSISKNNC